MKVEVLHPSDKQWRKTLADIRHDVYQTPEYLVMEANRTKSIAESILITNDDKVFFFPYLLRPCDHVYQDDIIANNTFDITSPYGYPGILVNSCATICQEFISEAINTLKENLVSRNICSVFIRFHPILNQECTDIFPENLVIDNGQTVSINLKLSEGELWAHTRKGHQSTINKCKRLGFIGRTVKFAEYYHEFIEIYTETMNRVKAKDSYYFDENYFSQLLQLGESLHLCVVELENKIICGSLFFESCGIVQAHLGGTKNEFLSNSPFNLLLHHARLYFKERGNEYLHIGGGLGGSTSDSLFTFKSGFSRQRHNFYTMRLITDPERYEYLIKQRAKRLNIDTQTLLESNFFPAYRYLLS